MHGLVLLGSLAVSARGRVDAFRPSKRDSSGSLVQEVCGKWRKGLLHDQVTVAVTRPDWPVG